VSAETLGKKGRIVNELVPRWAATGEGGKGELGGVDLKVYRQSDECRRKEEKGGKKTASGCLLVGRSESGKRFPVRAAVAGPKGRREEAFRGVQLREKEGKMSFPIPYTRHSNEGEKNRPLPMLTERGKFRRLASLFLREGGKKRKRKEWTEPLRS